MNTNRNNNRRRGRGNNRGQGGGVQGNRIDSRARGNAPQLLEKYRKLAHDASLNDDRVQTEYYLQFADHYFRVLADSRQKDDPRPRREGDREQSFDEDEDEEDAVEQTARDPRPQPRHARSNGPEGGPSAPAAEEGNEGSEAGRNDEDSNPFVRDARKRRERTPRARGKGAVQTGGDAGENNGADEGDDGMTGVDPAVLPPSIARTEGEPQEDKPQRPRATSRGRPRKARPADNGDAETLEAVN